MDVGYYLGELLMQRGAVKVPGLGGFSLMRMSAYYGDSEQLFYPPYNKVHFEPETNITDNDLAEYLVNKKGISLESAIYFIEKYIGNLKQQALVADIPLGNLGIFYTERTELTFKPADKLDNNADLFGFAPVTIFKADAIPAEPEPVPEFVFKPREVEAETEELTSEPVFAPVAEEEVADDTGEEITSSATDDDDAFFEAPAEEEFEEEQRRGPLRAILITVIILAVLGAGVFALYRYQPATFAKLQFWKNNAPDTAVKARPSTIVIPGIDTLNTDTAKSTLTDTTAKGVGDTLKTARYELIVGKGYKTLAEARAATEKLKAKGIINAKLVEELPGPLNRVSAGTFTSLAECQAARKKLIAEGKLDEQAFVQRIENE